MPEETPLGDLALRVLVAAETGGGSPAGLRSLLLYSEGWRVGRSGSPSCEGQSPIRRLGPRSTPATYFAAPPL